ncbi:hypothetical protein ACH5RR_040658 [Cinchona calisaya]|uniref:Uncharacterized protein n=1 Tax=Cinchona calisaya TaxID=153742 RepID=A0ABD2XTF7_9GENT
MESKNASSKTSSFENIFGRITRIEARSLEQKTKKDAVAIPKRIPRQGSMMVARQTLEFERAIKRLEDAKARLLCVPLTIQFGLLNSIKVKSIAFPLVIGEFFD